MKKILAICFLLITNVFAYSQHAERPKLIVFIQVDGLRYEYLDLYKSNFEQSGLNKLMEKGACTKHITYPYPFFGKYPDVVTIMSGSTPDTHGIIANEWLNRNSSNVETCFFDSKHQGVNTPLTLSPAGILTTTLADEIKMNSYGNSTTVVIGIDAEDAIAGGGHDADVAVWLDNANEGWATTSYYNNQLPEWMIEFEKQHPTDRFIEQTWQPLYPISLYKYAKQRGDQSKSFSYPLNNKKKKEYYKSLKTTPYVNKLVKEMAVEAVKQESLGKDVFTDLLVLNFSISDYIDTYESGQTLEMEDAYIRFDREIQSLLDFLENHVGGEEHLLVCMTGNRESERSTSALPAYRIPHGTFFPQRTMALLNSYLMALYGQANWVLGYAYGNVYLNHKKIEEKGITLKEIQEKTVDFLVQLSGIKSATPSLNIMYAEENRFSTNGFQQVYMAKRSGDVIIKLLPGWTDADKQDNVSKKSYGNSVNSVPLFLYGNSIKPQQLKNIQATDIFPSLLNLLNIPLKENVSGTESLFEKSY